MSLINDLAEPIHTNAVDKGFWDGTFGPDLVVAKLGLVHSEVSEMLEAYRKQMGSEKIMEEAADIIIRLLDLIAGLHEHGVVDTTDIEGIIERKVIANFNRPRLHGALI